jgi:hypothetical protein
MTGTPELSEAEKVKVAAFGLDRAEPTLTSHEADVAIGKILDLVPDAELPEHKVRVHGDGSEWAQFGGIGYGIGSAKRNGVLDPSVHRRSGMTDLLQQEVVYRLDLARQESAVSS